MDADAFMLPSRKVTIPLLFGLTSLSALKKKIVVIMPDIKSGAKTTKAKAYVRLHFSISAFIAVYSSFTISLIY